MRLSRQFLLLMLGLLVLVFVGTLAINTYHTRSFLANQLGSHAQDTATTLGLSIASAMHANNRIMVKSIADAIFDRGYYKKIKVVSMTGEVIFHRESNQTTDQVPNWFIKSFNLFAPETQSTITAGWNQVGKILVQCNTDQAYSELWSGTIKSLGWLGLVALATILSLFFLLRLIFTPLNEITEQANQIAKKEFPILNQLPKAPELRKVALAMNHMSMKIEQMLASQADLTEKMRSRAYTDSVTGLPNRRNFEERLQHLTRSPDEYKSGAIVIVRLENLREYNEQNGYMEGDGLLKLVTKQLIRVTEFASSCLVARIGGAEFGIIIDNVSPNDVGLFADELCRHLSKFTLYSTDQAKIQPSTGIAYFDGSQDASELLALADQALRVAKEKGVNRWYMTMEESVDKLGIFGNENWKEWLHSCIDQQAIAIHYQPVWNAEKSMILHYEAFARVLSQTGALLPAAVFIPMAERHGLASRIDRVVVSKLIENIDPADETCYAVNLSSESIESDEFVQWLCEVLQKQPKLAGRLIFETAEYSNVRKLEALQQTIGRIQQAGSQFSLDHFGISTASFGYLKNLKLDYIKFDGSYIREIDQNEDNQFFVRSLAELAHGLEIMVIADYVETEPEWHALQKLNVDGVQGYLAGAPSTQVTLQ